MKIYKEISLENFEAWSGGKYTLNAVINAGKVAELEAILEETEPAEGWSDTALNDLLWFDSEWVYETLDIRSYDIIQSEIDEKQEELDSQEEELQEELEGVTDEKERSEIIKLYKADIDALKDEIEELEEEQKTAPV